MISPDRFNLQTPGASTQERVDALEAEVRDLRRIVARIDEGLEFDRQLKPPEASVTQELAIPDDPVRVFSRDWPRAEASIRTPLPLAAV